MPTFSDKKRSYESFAVLIAALLAGHCASAHADVLEINGDSATWIARAGSGGGYASGRGSTSSSELEWHDIGEHQNASVTSVGVTAGPERWQLRVAELAAKYDISPQLLEALVWQESRWREGAVSPVGARGLAQLMPGTARSLGVNLTDPAANLEGGARYLRQQLDTFGGDLEKALAAYNAGPGRVQRAGGIPRIRETQDYVAAILARLSLPSRR